MTMHIIRLCIAVGCSYDIKMYTHQAVERPAILHVAAPQPAAGAERTAGAARRPARRRQETGSTQLAPTNSGVSSTTQVPTTQTTAAAAEAASGSATMPAKAACTRDAGAGSSSVSTWADLMSSLPCDRSLCIWDLCGSGGKWLCYPTSTHRGASRLLCHSRCKCCIARRCNGSSSRTCAAAARNQQCASSSKSAGRQCGGGYPD